VFAKLAAVVLALGACGCTLLALRQSRLQVASEIAQTQIRINQEDERLWVLRARIAERVTPEQVEQMAQGVGPLRPLVPPVLDDKAKQDLARTRQPQPPAAPAPRSRSQSSSPRVARGEPRR
jgi:hypothetical protein